MNPKNKYFAAQPKDELAFDLSEKLSEWAGYIDRNEIKSRWVKSYRLYYGRHFKNQSVSSDSEILRGGKEGELSLVTVNHYRNFIKHVHVMATNQKPAFDSRAINSDLKSLQQAKLANNILDAYLREKRLGRYLKTAAEQALVFGKGFVHITWEPSSGRPYSTEEKPGPEGEPISRIVYEGDVEVSCVSPFDVLVDPSQEDWNKCEWVLIRSFKNKFNLAARYTELKDKIEELPTKDSLEGKSFLTLQNLDATADTPVYAFYHKRTDAMPNGRYMLFCDKDTVLYDGPIPYKRLPVFRITPGEIFGTTEGYTDAFDIMALQEVINTLVSTAFSNQVAFGVQNVLIPEGANISVEQLGENLAGIKYNPNAGEPKALQLTNTPAEIFKLIELAERWGETLSGVNSVARGNPESSLKSGVALGLVQSMAVQYASGFQQSWAELLEDCGSFILDLLRDFAKTERMVAMAGKHNKGNMSAFTGDDLEGVDRVIVELGNPMARTTAGRVEIANNLLQQGLIKTPQEYLTVMNTGSLDPLTEGPEAELSLIRKENEEMMDGRPVQAIVGDAHVLHMQEHKALLANPQIRQQADILQSVLEHIQSHMQLYKSQDPLWSMVSGEPAAPQPQGPPPPPPGPQGPGPGDQGPPPGPQPEMPPPQPGQDFPPPPMPQGAPAPHGQPM